VRLPRLIGLLVGLLTTSVPAPAAAQAISDERGWWNVTFQERAGTESPWRWYVEVQGRTREGVGDFDQLIARPAVGYDLTSPSSLWAGHGDTPSYLAVGTPLTGAVLTENRAWQQYLWAGPGLGSALQWRTRIEQRGIEGNDRLAWRFRQFWRLTRQLHPRLGGLTFVTWDEVFVHMNDTTRTASGFDQNRVFVGVGVGPWQGARFEVGYVNQAVNGGRGADRRNHVVLAFLNATY
jgi:hypothetical protein